MCWMTAGHCLCGNATSAHDSWMECKKACTKSIWNYNWPAMCFKSTFLRRANLTIAIGNWMFHRIVVSNNIHGIRRCFEGSEVEENYFSCLKESHLTRPLDPNTFLRYREIIAIEASAIKCQRSVYLGRVVGIVFCTHSTIISRSHVYCNAQLWWMGRVCCVLGRC